MALGNRKFQPQKHNYIAVLFLILAVGVLCFHFQALKATADNNISSTRVPPAPEMPAIDNQNVQSADTKTANSEDINILQKQLEILEQGITYLEKIPHYTSIFSKREEIDGVLRDEEIMELKLRHEPFSVYMKWSKGDTGRELLYQENQEK